MEAFAQYCLLGTLILTVIALVMNLVVAAAQGRVPHRTSRAKAPVAVGVGGGGGAAGLETDDVLELDAVDDEPARAKSANPTSAEPKAKSGVSVGSLANGFTVVGFLLMTAYLVTRTIQAGYLPLTNMNGYVSAVVWIILASTLFAFWKFKIRAISVIALGVAVCLLGFILIQAREFDASPLMPALQNSMLLTLHVGFAVVANGAACVSFAAAVLYLIRPKLRHLKTSRERIDDLGYKAAVVMFPLWTIMVLLGSLWANSAWGAYWSWDPKETAALVSWLIYAAYLHARVVGGWRGTRSAWLLIIAFVSVLFTLFGNYFFGGLHSYA